MYSPPVGLLYLAAVLRERTGHAVEVFDDWQPADLARRFDACLRRFRPTVVGISALTATAELLHRLAAQVKQTRPETLVVAGGAHATAWPADCLADRNIDAVAVHEGEETLPRLVEALDRGQDLEGVPGLMRRGPSGSAESTGPAVFIEDLDALPHPAYDLIDLPFYWRHRPMSPLGPIRSLPILTSRGCPYPCTYCHQVMGKRFRARSVESVLDEIGWMCERHDIRALEVLDDAFNLDQDRAARILEGIIARGYARRLKLRFPNGLRVDHLDEPLLDLLRAAGTDMLGLGIESGSARIQRQIGKPVDLARAERLIRYADRIGVLVAGYFMVGFPGETEADLRATYEFALRSALHQAMFFIVIPFPGTALHERHPAPHNAPARLSDYIYFRTSFNLSDVEDERFFALRRQALRRFYTSPRRLWRLWRTYPDPWHLPRYIPFMLRSFFSRSMSSGSPEPA